MRARVYIDGFNLYYGIKRHPACKWLDLEVLMRRIFPQDEIELIRYFTARVKGKIDGEAPLRQQAYLAALRSLPRVEVTFGKFSIHRTWLPLAMPSRWRVPVLRPEEKGSDVNLATYLLVDAFNRACEMQVVVSNDSDLREPIRIVQEPPFDMPVWVVNPLQPFKTDMGAARHIDMRIADVRAAQFPAHVQLPDGRAARRPEKWT